MQNLKHSVGKISGIYCITNIENNKFYIGSSKNIYYRLRRHLSDLRANIHKNPKLQNAFNKYGEISFVSSILEETINLEKQEEFWIKKLNPIYNCVFINFSRLEFSDLQKERISTSMKLAIKEGRASCNKKALDVFDISGNKIDTLDSIKDFSDKYNITYSKAIELSNGKFNQWKGYRIFQKGLYSKVNPYILPGKGCMQITKNKFKQARIKLDELLENPEEDNQQPS
jgi:predicted GIY-YIG superfamily endonuclease